MDRVMFYTDVSEDGLRRKEWHFVLILGNLYLDWYSKQVRPSKRHKNWSSVEYYSRLGRRTDHSGHGDRLNVIGLNDEIKRVALEQFVATITVKVWDRP